MIIISRRSFRTQRTVAAAPPRPLRPYNILYIVFISNFLLTIAIYCVIVHLHLIDSASSSEGWAAGVSRLSVRKCPFRIAQAVLGWYVWHWFRWSHMSV